MCITAVPAVLVFLSVPSRPCHMSQLAPYYRSLLVAVLQRLLVSEHITEHPSIYFGIPNRIDVLDAMLVLVLTKLLSSQQSATNYSCSSIDFPTRAAQAQMNKSSLVCARPSDLPCLALAQDQLQPRILDQQQVLGRTLQTTTLEPKDPLMQSLFSSVQF